MPLRSKPLTCLLAVIASGCSSAPASPPAPPAAVTAPIASGSVSGSANAAAAPSGPIAPVAKKVPHVVELVNGTKLVDDYAWLQKKDAPEVLAHLQAENAYTDAMTAHLKPMEEKLHAEMLSHFVEDDVEVPYRDGAFLYYKRVEKGKQYPIECRKPVKGGEAAKEEVILDINELARTEKFVGIDAETVSDDGNLLAYGMDTTGFRQFVLHIKDLRTGKELPERVQRVTGIAFAKDNRTVFYTVEDAVTKRSYRLFRHEIGTDPAKDTLLYEEPDARFHLEVSRSSSRALILLQINSHSTSEVRFVRADKPAGPLVVVEPREQGFEYQVDHRDQELLITTSTPVTAGGPKSLNFRLVTAPLDKPGRASWKEVVPHRAEVMLEGVQTFAGFTVALEREGGVRQLRIFPGKKLALEASHRVELPEPDYALRPDHNAEFTATSYRFAYSSFITPPTIYEYSPAGKKLDLRKRLVIPGGYDASRYEVSRVVATAKDGTKVPISIAARKGTTADGKNPVFLTGYGSYGAPLFASFVPSRIPLLDRGVVYGIAHIRGGGELGKPWHEAGRMANKMNTFTDFIASVEALGGQRWADPKRIVIEGGSAGGLLVGAVTNLRPDLFAGVVAQVPFVDVVNTMLDESLPLTVEEFEEWGNPKKPAELATILQYSPYENVTAKAYPPVLVRTSYNDSQVMYWEPAKYVAKLRATRTDPNPTLLKIHLAPAGHGGLSGRYDRLRDLAFTYAWALDRLGVK